MGRRSVHNRKSEVNIKGCTKKISSLQVSPYWVTQVIRSLANMHVLRKQEEREREISQ
jgi:hypothetical protein